MASDGRRRNAGRRRLSADHGSFQGHDQIGRRMDQLDRAREHRRRPSGRRGSGRHRHAASEVGRAAAAVRRAQAWMRVDARGDARFLLRQDRQMVDSGRRHFPR